MSDGNINGVKSNEPRAVRSIVITIVSICFVGAMLLDSEHVAIYLIAFAASLFTIIWSSRLTSDNSPKLKSNRTSKLDVEAILSSLVEAFQHPVLIIDNDGIIEFANSESRELFNETKKGDQIFTRFRNPELRQVIESVMNGGSAVTIDYNQRVPGNRWFHVEVAPIKSANTTRILISFHDFSESKRIDEMRSDFIANASHELRTPLASLIGYLETLKGAAKKDPKAAERFIDVMLDQGERMTRLVNDLLSLSSIEMKANIKPSDVVDISEVANTVVSSLDKLSEQMGVEIILNIESGSLPVHGDENELIQVFENLLENACKYGDEGGQVEFDLKKEFSEGKAVAVACIRDFGPGIPAEHHHRITERFYRVDVAQSRQKKGTGLGLAIVKHILQRHGTRLQVASNPESTGTEFFVEFPLVDSE